MHIQMYACVCMGPRISIALWLCECTQTCTYVRVCMMCMSISMCKSAKSPGMGRCVFIHKASSVLIGCGNRKMVLASTWNIFCGLHIGIDAYAYVHLSMYVCINVYQALG